jgi:DNA-directed RNA polymerase subunit RPC12/RpoP
MEKIDKLQKEETIIETMKKLNFTYISGHYLNNKNFFEFKCNNCGYIKKTNWHGIFTRKSVECKNCNRKHNSTFCNKEEKIKLFKEKCDSLNISILSGEYKNNKSNFLLKCNKCKTEWKGNWQSLITRKNSCPLCSHKRGGSKKRRFTLNELKSYVKKITNNEYEFVSSKYEGNNIKYEFYHKKCKKIFLARTENFINKGNRCPYCSGSIKKTIEDARSLISRYGYNEYTLLSDKYENTNAKLLIKHSCGFEFNMSLNKFINRGFRCPNCREGGRSAKEQDFYIFIKKIYNDIIYKNFKYMEPLNKEVDIYLPKVGLGFEFNGIYWHSEKFKDKNYHYNKMVECKDRKIKLIQIFEDEWSIKNKQKIVKSKIKYLLHQIKKEKRLNARDCYIKEITKEKANIFLEKNHIQGKTNSSIINLGLFDKNKKLKSVMSFSKKRKCLNQTNNEFEFELVRFCSKVFYTINGAFGKLFKYFTKNYKFKNIVTYADRRWGEGTVYLSSGFIFSHSTKPNYWYVKQDRNRYHRFNFRKQKLKELFPDLYDENLTEFQIMDKTKYSRLWDCGNNVYYFNNEL